jgi:hypothetical protein
MADRMKTRTARRSPAKRAVRSHAPAKKPAARVTLVPASDRVLYLYGITRAIPSGLELSAGVDGASAVESLLCAGLTCWVSRVDANEYAARLSENMENLDWLAAASVRHQRVVAAIAAATDILPGRFGTVFVSERSLQADVRDRKASLLSALRRIAGTEEWGVKVFLTKPAKAAAVVAASGKDYLRRKAMQVERRREADPEVKLLQRELARIASDSTGGGNVSGGQRELEWHGSYLLRRNRRQKFQQTLRRFATRWQDSRRIEATGPWPPYSFVSAHARK